MRTTAEEIDRSACQARSNALGVPQHGTVSAYQNWGCRCADAREHYRLRLKRRRENRLAPAMISTVGTARRLQALARIGYSTEALAAWLAARPELLEGHTVRGGMSASRLRQLRRPERKLIWRPQAELVATVYEALSGTPIPPVDNWDRFRRYAIRRGWAPPHAWDDDHDIDNPQAKPQHLLEGQGESINEGVDLQLMITGRHPQPEKFETPAARRRYRTMQIKAVGILTGRGLGAPEIAELLHTSERDVVRCRKIASSPRGESSVGKLSTTEVAGTTPPAPTSREAPAA